MLIRLAWKIMMSLFAKDLHSSWTSSFINGQTLKMISQVESFLYPEKQGTPEEGWRIQQPKRCEKNNKDEDNCLETLTDKNHQASSQKFWHIMSLYKNIKTMICSSDFFDIVAGILQEDKLAPYLLILCLKHILWTSIDLIKENGFTLKKQEESDILKRLWQMQTMKMT